MSSLSLMKSIATCRVETGNAGRIQSDRFQNPNNMVCLPWNGMDNLGRSVCADSFYTKSAGCNLATDRVDIENGLRPKYYEYIGLNALGIDANIYGNNPPMSVLKTQQTNSYDSNLNNNTPNFGGQFQATNQPSCNMNGYERAMAQMSQVNRGATYQNSAYNSNRSKCGGGV